MKCLNCYSEFLPTLTNPLCEECGFCYYCRDFFSCFHYNIEYGDQRQPKLQGSLIGKKNNIKKWDSYNDIASKQTKPILKESAAVIVIDESVRRKLGKSHILELIQNITSPETNCYVDIIPTGTSDIDVIKVFNSYVDIPALILTSDKDLYRRLLGRSLFVKEKKGGNAVRTITKAIKHRISRL
jgi:hypothetical protein